MNLNIVILKSTISLERNRISLSHYTIPPIDDFADLLASAIDNSSQFGIKITNFYNNSLCLCPACVLFVSKVNIRAYIVHKSLCNFYVNGLIYVDFLH